MSGRFTWVCIFLCTASIQSILVFEKTKGKSRMDNPETLATLDIQDTGQRQTKHKTQNTTQKTEKMSNTDPHQKPEKKNPGDHER